MNARPLRPEWKQSRIPATVASSTGPGLPSITPGDVPVTRLDHHRARRGHASSCDKKGFSGIGRPESNANRGPRPSRAHGVRVWRTSVYYTPRDRSAWRRTAADCAAVAGEPVPTHEKRPFRLAVRRRTERPQRLRHYPCAGRWSSNRRAWRRAGPRPSRGHPPPRRRTPHHRTRSRPRNTG